MPDENKTNDEALPGLDDLISLEEAAELSEFSTGHLRHLARKGDLWAIKLTGNWLTTREALEAYLARERRPGPKTKKGS